MYGRARRRLFVTKVRGQNFHEDYHDYEIMRGGAIIHPRLVAAEHLSRFPAHTFTSAIENLDRMLGGGLDAGTTTLLLGPAGVGKSTVSMQFRRECPQATEHFAETAPFQRRARIRRCCAAAPQPRRFSPRSSGVYSRLWQALYQDGSAAGIFRPEPASPACPPGSRSRRPRCRR